LSKNSSYLLLLLIIFNLLLPVTTYSQGEEKNKIYSSDIYLLAVLEHDGGYVINAKLNAYYPGRGEVIFEAKLGSIAEETIISAEYALRLASALTGINYRLFDYEIILPENIKLEGTSATLAFTLAFLAFFKNISITEKIGVTGLVSPNGIIGNVSGLINKYNAALSYNLDKILGPPTKEMNGKYKYVSVGDIFTAFELYSGEKLYEELPSSKLRYLDIILDNFKYSYEFFYNQTLIIINKMKSIRNNTLNLSEISGYKYLLLAKNYSRMGEWYTAASFAFTSFIRVYEYYLTNILLKENPQELYSELKRIEDLIIGLSRELREDLIRLKNTIINKSIWVIDAYLNAYSRYRDAIFYYSISNKTDNLEDIALSYVLSLARMYTSKHWLSLVNISIPGKPIESKQLKRSITILKDLLIYAIKYLGSMNIIDQKEYIDILNNINGTLIDKFINYTMIYYELSFITQLTPTQIFPPYVDYDIIMKMNKTLHMLKSLFYLKSGVIPPSLLTIHRFLNHFILSNESYEAIFNSVARSFGIIIPEIILINPGTGLRVYIVYRTIYKPVGSVATLELIIGLLCVGTGSLIIGYVFGKTRGSRRGSYVSPLIYREKEEFSLTY